MIIEEISFSVGSYLADLALLFLPQEIYLTGGIGRNIIDEKSIMKGYFRDEKTFRDNGEYKFRYCEES